MLALCVEEEKTEIEVYGDAESGAWSVMMHMADIWWRVNLIVWTGEEKI